MIRSIETAMITSVEIVEGCTVVTWDGDAQGSFFDAHSSMISGIAGTTSQSWQIGRGAEETRADTRQGKLCEYLLKELVGSHSGSVAAVHWDEVRQDDFLRAAPTDLLIFPSKGEMRDLAEGRLDSCVEALSHSARNFELSNSLFETRGPVLTTEIKSTKINDRHRERGGEDVASLCRYLVSSQNMLAYPRCARVMPADLSFGDDDYLDLALSLRPEEYSGCSTFRDAMRREARQSNHILVQAFMDMENRMCVFAGALKRDSFYERCSVKRLSKPGKSDCALYVACHLTKTDPLRRLFNISEGVSVVGSIEEQKALPQVVPLEKGCRVPSLRPGAKGGFRMAA